MTKSNSNDSFGQEVPTKTANKYSASLIEEIIERLDILQVMEEEYDLAFEEPTNKGWWHTNCPLPGHRDSSPSFGVNPDLRVFKCLGCQEKGNVLHFVRKIEGIPFNAAVAKLAALAGIDDANTDITAYRALKDIESTVKAYLDSQSDSKLPAGLTPVEYMRAVAERLRSYELKVNFDDEETKWVDSVYSDIDQMDIAEDQGGMSKVWSSLARQMKDRYEQYEQRVGEANG